MFFSGRLVWRDSGYARRIQAFKQHHKIERAPFYPPMFLLTKNGAFALTATLAALLVTLWFL